MGEVYKHYRNCCFILFYLFYWPELGLVKGCLYLVGGYWASSFLWVRVGLYVKCLFFKYFFFGKG